MGKHTVEIGDSASNSFKISINIGYVGVNTEGSWRSLDKGWIRYHSGLSKKYQADGTITESNLCLFGPDGVDGGTGILLYKWDDIGGTNDQGVGELAQPWGLNAKPGKITWALVD